MLTKERMEENQKEYMRRLKKYLGDEERYEDLSRYILKTDIFRAPYSYDAKNGVCCYEGGLVEFTLTLCDVFVESFLQAPFVRAMAHTNPKNPLTLKNIERIALLYALNYVNFFSQDEKAHKFIEGVDEDYEDYKYLAERIVKDKQGRNTFWANVPFYKIDDCLPVGEGTRALAIAYSFVSLRKDEIIALKWCASNPMSVKDFGAIHQAYDSSWLTTAFHNAIMTTRYLITSPHFCHIFENMYGTRKCDERLVPAQGEANEEASEKPEEKTKEMVEEAEEKKEKPEEVTTTDEGEAEAEVMFYGEYDSLIPVAVDDIDF